MCFKILWILIFCLDTTIFFLVDSKKLALVPDFKFILIVADELHQ